LYSAYNGNLYQVKRASDSTTKNITPLSAGGVANAASQDTFCSGTTCLITIIYDQSGKANHLTQAPPGLSIKGPAAGGFDNLASATAAPITLNGQKAYGVFIAPGTGYRNDATSGIATGDNPEGLYAVFDGTHYNDACCFDYGNAETSNSDTGAGDMEAIYFGNEAFWGSGSGSGPWIMADMENGLFSGQGAKVNSADLSISDRFVTAIIKGEPNQWAIRGGNAASGALSTFYSGVRPTGYNPMHKQGAIILGIGGDNSNSAQGTFYEGVMTSGYPSDATENSVQANIVAAKYAASTASVNARRDNNQLTIGSSISLQATTPGSTASCIAHTGDTINTQVITSSNTTAVQQQASWIVLPGLGYSDCVSFESVDTPGSFIRQRNFELVLSANDGTKQFAEDATFCEEAGISGQGSTFRSWNHPTRYLRNFGNVTYAASNGGVKTFDDASSFNEDVSFIVSRSFA
jgi:hypothetical protein